MRFRTLPPLGSLRARVAGTTRSDHRPPDFPQPYRGTGQATRVRLSARRRRGGAPRRTPQVDGEVDRMSLPDLRGWLPVGITRHTTEPLVDWCRMGTRRFTESFFDHTVQAAMQEPFSLLFRHQLPLDSLIEWQERSPGLA